MASSSVPILSLAILGVLLLCSSSAAHLSTTDYYCKSCPNMLDTIKNQVKLAVARDRRTGAQILRLFFHDCFVQGCDASLLLDDTPTLIGEKRAAPNFNSARGFEVIDTIKAAVEKACPEVVSCADILAIAARDFVVELGGPYWDVKTGRRDSLTANQGLANMSIPRPTNNLNMLISSFQAQGLSTQDMVALSGAHTIGVARCTSFRNRIYNEANIDKFFASTRQANCPRPSGSGDNNLAPLDLQTPLHFDNNYYKNLVGKKGLLHSDQQLYNGGSTDYLVSRYSQDTKTFNKHFVEAMIKMGDIKPLTGSKGQVRKNCRRVN